MAVMQVQTINGQKVLVPVSGNAPVNVVQSGNNNPVSSNAVANMNNINIPVYNGGDVFTIAENCSLNKYSVFRVFNATTNYPPVINSNDVYYSVYKIEINTYIRIVAYDIRSDCIYTCTKINGTWGTWMRTPAIQSRAFNGTTDGNGFLSLDLNAGSYIVFSVSLNAMNPYRVQPIVSSNSNWWFIIVSDLISGVSASNVAVSGTVYFMQL